MPKVIEINKEDLLKIVRKHIDNEEYDKLTCRTLSKEANIGLGTLYKFFKSKQDFIAAIILEDWHKMMESVIINDNIDICMKSLYEAIYQFSCKYYDLWEYEKKEFFSSVLEKRDLLVNKVFDYINKICDYNKTNCNQNEKWFLAYNMIQMASSLFEYDRLEQIYKKIWRE